MNQIQLDNLLHTELAASQKKINYCVLIIAVSFLVRLLCIGSYDLLVEEAYYWNYSQHLDFGYLDHPPMVALLIKVSTLFFGTNEFGVRIIALVCWLLSALFIFKLTALINQKASQYAVLLLSILPFFFLQSLVITPDQPLLVCWSAALYCLYRALVLNEEKYWYAVGVWIGLGLISKYTIVLLGPATIIYMALVPEARHWFKRKEPYVCALLAALFFTPVIYWNATHEWASFIFQSTRRFNDAHHVSLHHFIIVFILFLMPLGVIGLFKLFQKQQLEQANIEHRTSRFLQVFTLFPLVFFGTFSLSHAIKLDWLGPGLLAVLPWLAVLMARSKKNRTIWMMAGVFFVLCYSSIIATISLGAPDIVPSKALQKLISWERLSQDLNSAANQVAVERQSTPILVPLDSYNLASELTFYQKKLLTDGSIEKSYPVSGPHIIGMESLMYRYWSHREDYIGSTLILITKDIGTFDLPELKNQLIDLSPPSQLWAYTQGRERKINLYYYKTVQLKS